MRVIALSDIRENPDRLDDIKQILESEKLICFPAASGYKLAADFGSRSAIVAMIQAKRRVKNAPSLVLVPDQSWVSQIAEEVSDEAERLMQALWPGPATLLFTPSETIDPKVRKMLTKATGWLGVRVPDHDVSIDIVRAFGRPLLVSSANLARKHGACSVAQVRKNFGRTVELLVDAGDLTEGPKSTLIDLTKGQPVVVRQGAVSEETVAGVLAG
jgi:L-threonylcarbamoyladenylate synthase